MKSRFLFLTVGFLISFPMYAQDGEQAEKYRKDAEDLISFVQYMFNALGNDELSVSDKDIIVNESYLKAFADNKVQIEDDLIDNREVFINKDVQAYLKDIDFFFRSVNFELRIEEISEGINEKNELFFTVKVNRRLHGISLNGDSINNSLTRFIELNVNPKQKDLRIASIYTTKIGEKEELVRWWVSLSPSWKSILGKDLFISEAYQLTDVSIVNDSTYFIGGQKVDHKVYNVFTAIKKATEITELDLSGSKEILGIEPLYELTKLRSLNISNTGISSLFPIRNLTTLETLNCSNTIIDDVSPLRYSSNLTELNISQTNVLDVDVIEGFKKLKVFAADHIQKDSLEIIASCKSLQSLSLESNKKVNDLQFLSGLTQLKYLNLKGTSIADISTLGELTNIEELNISNTKVEDIASVSLLKGLKTFSFEGTNISTLEPLLDTHISKIYCDDSGIDKIDVQAFLLKKPNARVVFQSEKLKKWWNDMDPSWKELVFTSIKIDQEPDRELLHEITRVDSINIKGHKEITNLNPLSEVMLVKKLNIASTSVKDLSPINDQLRLMEIDFSNTGISDISALKGKNQLENVVGSYSKVESIEPLRGLEKLAYIDLDGTLVKDISAINDLPSFHIGYFDSTRVTDEDVVQLDFDGETAILVFKTSHLQEWWGHLDDEWQNIFRGAFEINKTPSREELHKLTGLKKFIVKSILIKDISVMQEFIRLRELIFNDTQITDISPLGKMIKLEVLDCSRNPIEEIDPLSQMTSLRIFYADNTKISSIDALGSLSALEELKISNTEVKDLGPLQGKDNLQVLDFSNTKVKNIKHIMDLMALSSLRCFNNGINQKRIDEFKASHPNCEVVFY